MIYRFIGTQFNQYIQLQKDGTNFSELSTQSQRVANVLRGSTGINSAATTQVDCYAYFSPSDNYVSHIKYYLNPAKTQLLADVTRMTSDPPTGTDIATSLKTYTIISKYYQGSGVNLFTYLDSGGNALTVPISDLRTIKGVRVTLATPGSSIAQNTNQTISVQVSLRNRKVNL